MKKRIVFMGTPSFAVPTLEALIADKDLQVVAVITAVDKLGGRGRKTIIQSEVKKAAITHHLPVLQPANLKAQKFVDQFQKLHADLAVVVAFRMLPEVIWSAPKYGTMNLHASLLPAYRGAAPINWAIIKGEKISGLTTFLIAKEIDTGNIIHQKTLPIEETDSAGDLHDKMMYEGAALVSRSVRDLLFGVVQLKEQDHSLATRAPKIFHEDCQIDSSLSAHQIYNFIRGLSPYPGAWIMMDQLTLKIFGSSHSILKHSNKPGSLVALGREKLRLYTYDGYVEFKEVQLQGKKKMDVSSFLNGYDLAQSDVIQLRN
ncbi:MAG: methionyl-tRNA formyltransferase [Saprospiraceae bacterium]|nr:methionyl-tRNA formyltransferase [Saprospiraceae bacterium]